MHEMEGRISSAEDTTEQREQAQWSNKTLNLTNAEDKLSRKNGTP